MTRPTAPSPRAPRLLRRPRQVLLRLAWALGCAAAAAGTPAQGVVSRGQLLYQNHCAGCHGTQMHWRDEKRATDWASLLAQVQQWQARDHLNWSDADVQAVASYLNDTIYRLPRPERRAGFAGTR